MKHKIYDNREVLRGKRFKTVLLGNTCEFKIVYVNEKGINITKSISYREMQYAGQDSLEGIIKNIILENNPNSQLSLSRKAYMSATKLKKIPIVIEGYKFRFSQITNSAISLDLFIGLDDLLENDDNLINNVKRVVLSNLKDNPPKVKKSSNYWHSFTTPYLFDSGGNDMHFVQLGHRRTVVSESKLEENREKFAKIREEEKLKREKAKELDKELGLDKKKDIHYLARHR